LLDPKVTQRSKAYTKNFRLHCVGPKSVQYNKIAKGLKVEPADAIIASPHPHAGNRGDRAFSLVHRERRIQRVVNHWHANHAYRHETNAILSFWLMTMIASNLFRVFYIRDLKPQFRKKYRMLHMLLD
jgi:hypothetical protein